LRGFLGNDVAAFAGGDNHAGVAGTVFHDVYKRAAEEAHFKRFAVAVGNNNHLRALREVAERMSAADALPGPSSAPLLLPVSEKLSEHVLSFSSRNQFKSEGK
jgi:hypothetical protein